MGNPFLNNGISILQSLAENRYRCSRLIASVCLYFGHRKKKHCVIRENNILSIITGVKENQAIYQPLDDKNQDTVKLVSLIQRILDKGEFTASRPFHSDSFENYLLKQDAPHMHFGLSSNNNSILAGRGYTWYYTHDKELEEAGLRNIAVELDGIFTRLENGFKVNH